MSDGGTAKTFAELLAENLKALNAKERDHLMRLAYLGQAAPYDDNVEQWLSPEMDFRLRDALKLPATARCIFAGMDYHLDWVFAALKFSCEDTRLTDVSKSACYRCDDGRQEDIKAPGDLVGVAQASSGDDPTLLPVSGRQEDVDLLVLFAAGGEAFLLFVEAKGAAPFDPLQLARKLIRIDRILARSGALDACHNLACKLVLTAPSELHASEGMTIVDMVLDPDTLERLKGSLEDIDKLKEGIGKNPVFLKLEGFPSAVSKVARVRIKGKPRTYIHWKVAKR